MKEASLMEHLEELRSRILISVVAWCVTTGVAFFYREQLLMLLRKPLDDYNIGQTIKAELIVLGITEPFVTAFKVAGFGGLALALPIIAWQVWGFIAPGLYDHERRLAVPAVIGAGFSFAAGVAFAYLIMLPVAVPFLLGFLGAAVTPQISIGQYMSQILTMLCLMGLVFEMPVLSYVGAHLGFLRSKLLIEQWRIAVVVILVISALITPTPDPVNMMIVAAPLSLLYLISVGVVSLVERGKYKKA